MTQIEFPKIFPIIKTERLILRGLTHADTHAIFKNFSDPDIAKWFFEKPLSEIEQASKFIDQFNSEFQQGEGITWAIALRENSECIGTCGYGDIRLGDRGEIGFDLAKEHWGKGFMSESLIAITDYGFSFLNLSKVEAHTYSNNIRAKHLLEKLGFQLDNVSEDSNYYFLSKKT
ncbi:MAG TPA: GNAT family N-acetyltransferase [Anaerolineales bacterium]